MIFLPILIVYLLVPSIYTASSTQKPATSQPFDVCELDNSCNSTSEAPLEIPITTEANSSEKLMYNISGMPAQNETINIIPLNNTNTSNLNLNSDITKVTYDNSTASNTTQTKMVEVKFHIEEQDICFCDIYKGSCDINCCCDLDCLHVNRNVFEMCNKTEEEKVDEVCLSKILDSPLLCVIRDNLYSKHFYPAHKKTDQKSNMEKLLRNREVFGWTIPGIDNQLRDSFEYREDFKEYHIGSSVLMYHNNSGLQKFRLPRATFDSRDCSQSQPVNFLENYETVCTHRITKVLTLECEDERSVFNPYTYYKNFTLIKDPTTLNSSQILTCEHNCIHVVPFVCNFDTSDISSCRPHNFSSPLLNKTDNATCRGAVSSVHYNFFHNGTEGISSARVFIHLSNMSMKPNLLWAIKFKLSYDWHNQTDSYELSGYPGYISGKPIITGFKVHQNISENRTKSVTKMSNQKSHWLSKFSSDPLSGNCIKQKRDNLLFQENLYARCYLKIEDIQDVQDCEKLQNEIFQILFGPTTNISDTFISAYGTPKLDDSSNWIPIMTDLAFNSINESCSGIVTSATMIILHAEVGDYDNTQNTVVAAKITGVRSEQDIQQYRKLPIVLAVNFYDVTNPPMRIFAEPPTYEVKLPTDFFYPFFASSANTVKFNDLTGTIFIFLSPFCICFIFH